VLTFRGVRKSYGDVVAISALDLTVRPAETTALIGPSGCGKSTLLRLAAGLVLPDTGTVTFDGLALSPATIEAARHRMGYVIQEGGLFPHLTARANVTLLADHLRRPRAWIDDRVESLRDLVRLPADSLARFPTELSGGQRQRVALMRALMLDPDLLLLDEPLGALDPLIRADLQRELRAIFGSLGTTVLLVTHDLNEAARLADRILLMNEGVLVQDGTFADLRDRPTGSFARRFVSAWDAP